MSMKVIGYKGKYRIVSIALNESVRDDLLKNMLDTVYVTSESVTIYPENEILTTDKDIIQRLYDGNNYDVYALTEDGRLFIYYDDRSIDNYFFVTGKCNSNCMMCPSPESSRKRGEDTGVENLVEIAKHIPTDTPHLTVTGGEPFLIGEKIFSFLEFLKEKFEYTEFLFLTNGRIFAIDSFAKQFRENMPFDSIVAIPIHGSNAEIHDGITQSKNSFRQTKAGIKNLLALGIRVEIRIVVSALNKTDIENIARLIVKEFSEVTYVSIIAMEMTGSAYLHREVVWIPYSEAAVMAEKGSLILMQNGIDVKLYNFPLCTVEKKYWTLCEKSISPDKIRYASQCSECIMYGACGGVFAGTLLMEKEELKAIV